MVYSSCIHTYIHTQSSIRPYIHTYIHTYKHEHWYHRYLLIVRLQHSAGQPNGGNDALLRPLVFLPEGWLYVWVTLHLMAIASDAIIALAIPLLYLTTTSITITIRLLLPLSLLIFMYVLPDRILQGGYSVRSPFHQGGCKCPVATYILYACLCMYVCMYVYLCVYQIHIVIVVSEQRRVSCLDKIGQGNVVN